MKKIISMILCLALLMGLAVSASAAEDFTKIMDDAYALGENSTLGDYTLTGEITDIQEISTSYGNATFTIKVQGDSKGREILCFRAKGDGYDTLTVGAVVQVSGTIMTYYEKLEVSPCTLDKIISEGETVENDPVAEYVSSISTKATYKLGMYQGNTVPNKQLYFDGNTKEGYDYYLTTTGEAVNVYVEEVSGGYRLYFMDGSNKTYFDIIVNGTYVNISLTTTPTSVYVWNEEYDTLVTTVETADGEVEYYLGTYNTFDTISAGKLEKIGTSFPCHLYLVDAGEDDTTTDTDKDDTTTDTDKDDTTTDTDKEDDKTESTDKEDDKTESTDKEDNKTESTDKEDDKTESTDKEDDKTESTDKEDDKTESTDKEDDKTESTDKEEDKKPASKPVTTITSVSKPNTGVAYKLGLNQENLGKKIYFTGEMAGYYLATSETYSDGVDVYVEAVDGGYYLYGRNGDTKTYIDTVVAGNYINLVLVEEPTVVYTWNSDYDTFVAKLGDTEYYMGTYNEYHTLGASKMSFIETSFPAHLYVKTTSSSNAGTGDTSSVFVAMMTIAAIGAGILVSKKKEF